MQATLELLELIAVRTHWWDLQEVALCHCHMNLGVLIGGHLVCIVQKWYYEILDGCVDKYELAGLLSLTLVGTAACILCSSQFTWRDTVIWGRIARLGGNPMSCSIKHCSIMVSASTSVRSRWPTVWWTVRPDFPIHAMPQSSLIDLIVQGYCSHPVAFFALWIPRLFSGDALVILCRRSSWLIVSHGLIWGIVVAVVVVSWCRGYRVVFKNFVSYPSCGSYTLVINDPWNYPI